MEWFGMVGLEVEAWLGMVALLPSFLPSLVWPPFAPTPPLIAQLCDKTPGGGGATLQVVDLALIEVQRQGDDGGFGGAMVGVGPGVAAASKLVCSSSLRCSKPLWFSTAQLLDQHPLPSTPLQATLLSTFQS